MKKKANLCISSNTIIIREPPQYIQPTLQKYKRVQEKTEKQSSEGRERTRGTVLTAQMLPARSDGGVPIKLQIKTHILFKCQWDRGDITRVEEREVGGMTEKKREDGSCRW